MVDDKANAREAYLRKLGWGLAKLEQRDRDGIVDETRAHILDRLDQGASLEAVLAALGPPEVYARHFHEEAELISALAGQGPITMFGAVVSRAHRNAAAAMVFLLILCLFTAAGLGLVVCAMKLIDPEHVGLWVAPGHFFFGHSDEQAGREEVLGLWIFPMTFIALAGAWLLARQSLVWALRTQRRGLE